MNFNFGKVLTRSWQIIWKHKVLWIFGILASCARGNGGGNSGGRGGGNNGFQVNGDTPNLPFDQMQQGMERFSRFFENNWWIILLAVVGIIFLSIIFYALGMMGRIGLIKGTYMAENGAASLSFGELWSGSMPYFWRIFGLNFLIGLAFAVLIIPLVLFGVFTAGVGFACLLPLICILVPVAWVVNIIIEQAQPAIVLENLGIIDGLRRGWEIVRSNVGAMIIMALILMIGGAIIGIVIALPVIIAVLPLILGAGSLSQSLTPVWIALACCAAYFPILLFFNGVLTAYIQSAWTLTYMEVTKPKENAPVFVEANA